LPWKLAKLPCAVALAVCAELEIGEHV
jgi:hypothetical protein